jgi:hypothetical protein
MTNSHGQLMRSYIDILNESQSGEVHGWQYHGTSGPYYGYIKKDLFGTKLIAWVNPDTKEVLLYKDNKKGNDFDFPGKHEPDYNPKEVSDKDKELLLQVHQKLKPQ